MVVGRIIIWPQILICFGTICGVASARWLVCLLASLMVTTWFSIESEQRWMVPTKDSSKVNEIIMKIGEGVVRGLVVIL